MAEPWTSGGQFHNREPFNRDWVGAKFHIWFVKRKFNTYVLILRVSNGQRATQDIVENSFWSVGHRMRKTCKDNRQYKQLYLSNDAGVYNSEGVLIVK